MLGGPCGAEFVGADDTGSQFVEILEVHSLSLVTETDPAKVG
jgi:hypothetical protein